nr:basic salivary proline-rich protein 3-like [Camelus dromedarius]
MAEQGPAPPPPPTSAAEPRPPSTHLPGEGPAPTRRGLPQPETRGNQHGGGLARPPGPTAPAQARAAGLRQGCGSQPTPGAPGARPQDRPQSAGFEGQRGWTSGPPRRGKQRPQSPRAHRPHARRGRAGAGGGATCAGWGRLTGGLDAGGCTRGAVSPLEAVRGGAQPGHSLGSGAPTPALAAGRATWAGTTADRPPGEPPARPHDAARPPRRAGPAPPAGKPARAARPASPTRRQAPDARQTHRPAGGPCWDPLGPLAPALRCGLHDRRDTRDPTRHQCQEPPAPHDLNRARTPGPAVSLQGRLRLPAVRP